MRMLALGACALVMLAAGCSYECGPTSCADGCCGANGVCYVGATDSFCGLKGAACADCTAQQKLCSQGVCDLACVEDTSCSTEADCCSSHRCIDQKCTPCRIGGEPCVHSEDCCGYPSRHCERKDPYLPFVCR